MGKFPEHLIAVFGSILDAGIQKQHTYSCQFPWGKEPPLGLGLLHALMDFCAQFYGGTEDGYLCQSRAGEGSVTTELGNSTQNRENAGYGPRNSVR